MGIKRTGTMICLICNIVTVIFFFLICKSFTNTEILIDNIIIGIDSFIIIALAILFIRNKIKKEYMTLYSISMLALSIVILIITLVVSSDNPVCCYMIYIIVPIISLIGSIMILIGKGKKDEKDN